MSGNNKRTRRSFSPIYLAIFSGIILLLLTLNGLLEINRTQKGFYLLLEREAAVLIQHIEKSLQKAIESLQSSRTFLGMEEWVAEHLIDVLLRIDQLDSLTPLTSTDLQSLIHQYSIASIELFDPKGKRLRAWPDPPFNEKGTFLRDLIEKKQSVAINLFEKPLTDEELFTFAIERKKRPGIIAIQLRGNQVKELLRQFAAQRALSELGLRETILFVSVLDSNLMTLAHTDISLIGKKEADPFLEKSLHTQTSMARLYQPSKGEEIFEVVKSFVLKDRQAGIIRIGYSSAEVRPLINQIKKSVALSIVFSLLLGLSATALIWANQNRHLRKMEELESRIQLAERLSSLGHLAAGVAHEIRNPLNAIGMGLQRLRREFPPEEEGKKEEYFSFLDLILKEIRRVNEIIEQFLSLSRPFDLKQTFGSLTELLKQLVTLFEEEARTKEIKLQLELRADLPLIQMDEQKLTQAFINIMKNGIQSMDYGGTLRVETQRSKESVEVIFTDSGSGIPEDQMEKIFNYYYTTKEKGVGLGLPIAHRIIEAHGGRLRIESKTGVGTKVTITLPLKSKQGSSTQSFEA